MATLRERLLKAWTYKVGRDTAEDVAQETLLLLETKYAHVTGETDLVKLSFTISSYVEKSIRRKFKRDRELPTPDEWSPPDPAVSQEYSAFLATVRSKIAELRGRCPELLPDAVSPHSSPNSSMTDFR